MRAYYGTVQTGGKLLPVEYEQGIRTLMGMTPEEAEELCDDAAPEDGAAFLEQLERA